MTKLLYFIYFFFSKNTILFLQNFQRFESRYFMKTMKCLQVLQGLLHLIITNACNMCSERWANVLMLRQPKKGDVFWHCHYVFFLSFTTVSNLPSLKKWWGKWPHLRPYNLFVHLSPYWPAWRVLLPAKAKKWKTPKHGSRIALTVIFHTLLFSMAVIKP